MHYFSSFLFFHAGNDSHKVLLQNKEKNFEGFFLLLEKNDEKKNYFQLIERRPCEKLYFRYFDSANSLLNIGTCQNNVDRFIFVSSIDWKINCGCAWYLDPRVLR